MSPIMPHSTHSSHPYHSLIPDTLSIIFQYHIFNIYKPISRYSRHDVLFLQKYTHSLDLSGIKEFYANDGQFPELELLQELHRGIRRKPLMYLSVRGSRTLNNETFTFFRGVPEVDLRNTSKSAYSEVAFENLRDARILDIHSIRNLSPRIFENLRNVHTLDIGSQCRNVDFANLRRCKRLIMMAFTIESRTQLENLHGIEEIFVKICKALPSQPDPIIHLRGARRVHIRWNDGWDLSVLENFRGVEEVYIESLHGLTREAMANFRGVKILRLPGCVLPPQCLEQLRGIQTLNIGSVENIPAEEFVNLIGIQELAAIGLTDEMVQYFCGIKILRDENSLVTNHGLAALTSLEELAFLNNYVTDESLSQLRNLRVVRVWCENVDGTFLKHLQHVQELDLSWMTLCEDSLTSLAGIPKIFFFHAEGLTKKLFHHISGVKEFACTSNSLESGTILTMQDLPLLKKCFAEAETLRLDGDFAPQELIRALESYMNDQRKRRLCGEEV